MRNFFIGLILVIVGIKYGFDYLMSPSFQEYANRTKAPWSCQFENLVGQFYLVTSDYKLAQAHFEHVIKRCPGTDMDEEAEFAVARAAEGAGDHRIASQLYMDFAEKYKSSPRARTATRAADLLRTN